LAFVGVAAGDGCRAAVVEAKADARGFDGGEYEDDVECVGAGAAHPTVSTLTPVRVKVIAADRV
jgi:hypothetical protein